VKVAIVMPLAQQRGGAELALQHLLLANRRAPRVEYTLAFLEEGPMADEAEALGYQVRVFAAGRLRQLHRYIQTVVALATWLRRERVQMTLSWMAKAHLYAAPATRLAGSPAVWYQHGIPEAGWLDRWATRLPARAVFCCSLAAQEAQQRLSPPRPTRVIYPAVDLERFDPERLPTPAEARVKLDLPTHGPLIGILARLQWWKGLHVFLEAAARVLRVYSEAQFVILGDPHFSEPNYPTELVEQARQAGYSEQVHFAGYQREIPLWMQALDIVVNASVGPEPFGMTIIEAMALNKSVVATRQGGPLEIINHGKDGLLVQPDDAGALASAILHLIEHADSRRVIGKAARQRAQQFGTDRLATELARHLAEAVQ
jgi:glycosyltransferase involved in cell wall biosynthesis